MLINVRGPGTLEARYILGRRAVGRRVDRIVALAGTSSSPIRSSWSCRIRTDAQAEEARYGLEIAKATFAEFELALRSKELDQKSSRSRKRGRSTKARG